jgi:hypothetical protein
MLEVRMADPGRVGNGARTSLAAVLAVTLCACPPPHDASGVPDGQVVASQAAAFVPNETRMSDPRLNVGDPEFEPQNLRVAYFNNGEIRVAPIVAGGMVDLASSELVDTGAVVRPDPRTVIKNGPEWGLSRSGWDLYYTKVDALGRPYMARATRSGNGSWAAAAVPTSTGRFFPMPSIDPLDPVSRILYGATDLPSIPHTVRVRWRAGDESDDHNIPAYMLLLNGPSRWIEGQRRVAASIVEPFGSGWVSQVVLYDIDTGVFERVTANTSPQVLYDEVWCVRAPEYDDRYVVWAVENTVSSGRIVANTIKVFEPGASGGWTEARSVRPSAADPALPFIISPEPFTFKGRSYIAVLMSPAPIQKRDVGQLWILGLDGFERQLTPPGVRRSRTEPEPLAIGGTMYVYFSAQALDATGTVTGNKTIFRSDTGL